MSNTYIITIFFLTLSFGFCQNSNEALKSSSDLVNQSINSPSLSQDWGTKGSSSSNVDYILDAKLNNYDYLLKGKIADKYAVIMCLNVNDNIINGYYSYLSNIEKRLLLKGKKIDHTNFILEEFDSTLKKTGEFKGKFDPLGSFIFGFWSKPSSSNKMKFSLDKVTHFERINSKEINVTKPDVNNSHNKTDNQSIKEYLLQYADEPTKSSKEIEYENSVNFNQQGLYYDSSKQPHNYQEVYNNKSENSNGFTFFIVIFLIALIVYWLNKKSHLNESPRTVKSSSTPVGKVNSSRKERNDRQSKAKESNRVNSLNELAKEGGIQLNKCAISMGFAIKMLDDFENNILIDNNFESLLTIAYICRKGIINRVDKYPFWISNNNTIVIPTSQFTQVSKTMEEAMDLSVNRLKRLASGDRKTYELIENILSGGNELVNLERKFPNEIKPQLNIFCQIDS